MINKEFKFTREWFQDKKNQVHTIQDINLFNDREYPTENIIQIGEHFLVDLIPINDSCSDVEIWEVENTKKKYNILRRGKLPLKPIRKITTGKKFGFPNGYWRVPEVLSNSSPPIRTSDKSDSAKAEGFNKDYEVNQK